MNCSRRSTFTGRSMIGMRNLQARAADEALVRLAQPEDDHLLVLLDDPDGEVEEDARTMTTTTTMMAIAMELHGGLLATPR